MWATTECCINNAMIVRHFPSAVCRPTVGVLFLLGSLLSLTARADAPAQMIRALTARHGGAVVTLSLVVKLSSGGYEDQSEMEAVGTLLDASGLVVTTNSAVDPMAAYADDSDGATAMTSRVVGVKILTAAGMELPAKVVLRDKDLNLAFVRPLKKPAIKLTGVNFAAATRAQIGDPVFLLGRQGKTGSRSLEARCERVVSVLEKPRRFYVLQGANAASEGNVAFNESGQPLGLLTLRNPVGKARYSDRQIPVILPAHDVWEIARQAPPANAASRGSTRRATS